jgi:hypothetical protein
MRRAVYVRERRRERVQYCLGESAVGDGAVGEGYPTAALTVDRNVNRESILSLTEVVRSGIINISMAPGVIGATRVATAYATPDGRPFT